mmetsp:Transcript_105810/g.341363  ORF Transcript_105810/g.341363 Transcript_105810/m.341363 type:complete len:240 (+) Transcript_105810:628-1347(+)
MARLVTVALWPGNTLRRVHWLSADGTPQMRTEPFSDPVTTKPKSPLCTASAVVASRVQPKWPRQRPLGSSRTRTAAASASTQDIAANQVPQQAASRTSHWLPRRGRRPEGFAREELPAATGTLWSTSCGASRARSSRAAPGPDCNVQSTSLPSSLLAARASHCSRWSRLQAGAEGLWLSHALALRSAAMTSGRASCVGPEGGRRLQSSQMRWGAVYPSCVRARWLVECAPQTLRPHIRQ